MTRDRLTSWHPTMAHLAYERTDTPSSLLVGYVRNGSPIDHSFERSWVYWGRDMTYFPDWISRWSSNSTWLKELRAWDIAGKHLFLYQERSIFPRGVILERRVKITKKGVCVDWLPVFNIHIPGAATTAYPTSLRATVILHHQCLIPSLRY